MRWPAGGAAALLEPTTSLPSVSVTVRTVFALCKQQCGQWVKGRQEKTRL